MKRERGTVGGGGAEGGKGERKFRYGKFRRRDAGRRCLGLEEISVNRAGIIRMLCYGGGPG